YEILLGKVKDVQAANRLKSDPVCLSAAGALSLEMERILQSMPNYQHSEVDTVLVTNADDDMINAIQEASEKEDEQFKLLTIFVYNQARLIDGLPVEDPVAFTNDMCKVMTA